MMGAVRVRRAIVALVAVAVLYVVLAAVPKIAVLMSLS